MRARASTGSPENLARLADPASGVSVAFVQGGVGDPASSPRDSENSVFKALSA